MEKDPGQNKPDFRKHKTAFRKPDSYWRDVKRSTDPAVRARQIAQGFKVKGEEELAASYELFAQLHPGLLEEGFEGKFAVIAQERLVCVSESVEEGLEFAHGQQIPGKIVVRRIVHKESVRSWPPNSRVEMRRYKP